MKVTILKENLQKALGIVNRNISLRPQLPILNNILIKIDNDGLIIASSSLEIGVKVRVSSKIDEAGEITVPGRLFTEYISQLPAEKIVLLLEKDNLVVKTQKTRASFATLSAKDFPPFPVVKNEKPISLLSDIFQNGIMKTSFAASIDEGRPVLTGIRIRSFGDGIGFYATDGYRLSIYRVKVGADVTEMDFIFPARVLVEVSRIMQEEKVKEIVFVSLGGKNQVVFSIGEVTVATQLIEGEFPSIEKIIPTSFKTRAIIEAESFLKSVKICSLFARGSSNIVKLKIEKNGINFSANTPQIGENSEFMEASIEGEEMEIAFNFRFLLDLLNNYSGKEIVFESSGALNPGLFKPTTEGKEEFLHIIMPVRLQG